ncbi:heavy metal transporter [Chryseolinea lacunae]|uniref:Heavy metal transporter n=1 Tax=Chryseolinea lacunae TaxID=2801331 RepID=A0ABS1KS73_9BACT|nr:heavy metal transporter [Chryseolinea lacunae]MBL0741141.1 heavy metal transporter [Chryseolinea lacunae]
MAKTIRPTYPVEFSVGLLILIFVLSFFLSSQLFEVGWRELIEGTKTSAYVGMFLISSAVIIMVLVLWEEFLFPVKIKPGQDGVVFRNHRTKLKTQLLIYCIIPAIFIFVYFNFEIHIVRFIIWAALCTILPLGIKLMSGLKNYNDFLKLTDHTIEYKNNQKSGVFAVKDIQRITLIRDDSSLLHKFQVSTANGNEIIDLDEMELEAFLSSIDQFISSHYKNLLV